MKSKALFKTLFVALLALGGLAAGPAAARTCTLELNAKSSTIAVGQSYSLTVRFVRGVDFGPPPPPNYPYQVIFHGTRDGVWDTGSGQYLMDVLANGTPSTVSSYNPGGIAGQYMRYAEIRMPPPYNQTMCYTNVIIANFL
jgi:hypothetical protein